ncbi:MAG: hypothetical protein RR202_10540 [Bacteroidales bacterium]
MKIPFNPEYFSDELKPCISGVNVSLEYDNVSSALVQAATVIQDLIGEDKYMALMDKYEPGNIHADETLGYMQRAMIHMAISDQLIFLITRIGNDGVTVKKNEDETTIFKYQQDQLEEKLITTTWFWMDRLITAINLPQEDGVSVTLADFTRYVGISSPYFLHKAKWIIREVYEDLILPRYQSKEGFLSKYREKVARAIAYNVVKIACQRLPYADLPDTIRREVINEHQGKNTPAVADVLKKVAEQYQERASKYILDIDSVYLTYGVEQSERKVIHIRSEYNPNDKFCVS